jgi:hypothetical protein
MACGVVPGTSASWSIVWRSRRNGGCC